MSRVCRGLESCPCTQNPLRKRVISHLIVCKLSSGDGKLSQVTGLYFETWLSRGGSGALDFFGSICQRSPCAGSASKNLLCHPLRTTCVSARLVHNVLRVAAVGDYGELHCHPALKFDRSTQFQFCTLPPIAATRCWQLAVCPECLPRVQFSDSFIE